MFTSRTCVRSRRSTCMQDGSRARVKLLYVRHYVSDSIPTKLFWGLTFSSAGGLSEEKYQSQFGNIFPVALFCPPYLSSPPSQVLDICIFFAALKLSTCSSPSTLYTRHHMPHSFSMSVASLRDYTSTHKVPQPSIHRSKHFSPISCMYLVSKLSTSILH